MQKESVIEEIEKAEKYQRIQIKKLKNMLTGIETTKPTPLKKESCEFGKWLYSNAKRLQWILGTQFYDNLDNTHAKWHEKYHTFFNLYYIKKEAGFFSKAKITFTKIDGPKHEKALEVYEELSAISQELLQQLDICKKRLYALPKAQFEEFENQKLS